MRWIARMQKAMRKPARRWVRFLLDVTLDMLLVTFSLWAALCLLLNSVVNPLASPNLLLDCVALSVSVTLVLFWRGVYSTNIRYFGLLEFLSISAGGAFSMLLLFALDQYFPVGRIGNPVIWPLMFTFIQVTALSGVRILQRQHSWRRVQPSDTKREVVKRRRTLIVGAGDAGEMIVREIRRSSNPAHLVVGLVDDDAEKKNLRIHSIKVLGNTEDIPTLVEDLEIEELLIALPSATGEDMRRVNNLCQKTGARVRTLPAVKTILASGPQMISSHLREVDIEDLLRREPVQTNIQEISGYLSGERVMITGGGGSIGSELARQIANFAPASLILVGKGENSIYEIEQELLQTNRLHPSSMVADVRDRASMQRVFEEHQPTVVFHAAAHKHVPLMQGNPIEAIRNNVLGTWLTAELAMRHGAKQFILVSTDKAVKPTSVMGATKRVAEMIVSAFGARSETEFGIVRFGNVLGSRGSLIPLLKAQIKRGGPVRVTDPEMTRYFMTIPEAVQLILQAGAMGERGEIFLLDMGQPIKILDLANDLIRLHGLVPGEDIQINFTGKRPGEKIHEELLYEQEAISETAHPKIGMVGNGQVPDWEWLKGELHSLLELCDQGKPEEARRLLMEMAWGKTLFPISAPSDDRALI